MEILYFIKKYVGNLYDAVCENNYLKVKFLFLFNPTYKEVYKSIKVIHQDIKKILEDIDKIIENNNHDYAYHAIEV